MQSRLLLWAALAAFAIDQISKYLVVHVMRVAEKPGGIDVLPPLLVFKYGENRGINFGLFQGNSDSARWVLIGISIAICVGVLIWLSRIAASKLMLFCAGLLIGGALGNVVDRLLYGYVLDFLNMSCCGINNPFVFNLADVFIFAGALGLVLFDSKKPS
ncbi:MULTISPECIES: signal peptidase II [unclassified Ruegeria]|uniref:signal peptidase II n=1 Tax=unclassified Ruegeria TaxID=2625375 RepID=UPI0014895F0D|nr:MULTISPECIES: signal peptidase II [unclassified Ruegeria]NOD33109.1 signal peptidase II [Ruegeria sp. HKCCD7296]NOD48849.1 signal peptidase II [Ruegeria sp. HKCCD5849]NOD51848.1 signal peptidase II [Ruegeria sp. HKCCD5851]NOD66506.1 signal peptidase II [Ruegeria sp. HKCCD7303]NOE34007.1 signal peptidase II [Ruegeria sp. HKCCD7318]